MVEPINRILVIRRDNIGDLICTTPLLKQLRLNYPNACIDLLVNSYNYPVVALNKDVSHIYIYTKGKHKQASQSFWQVYWQRLKLIYQLKKKHYDVIILAGGYSKHAERLAKHIGALRVIGFSPLKSVSKIISHPIQYPTHPMHEVSRTLLLLEPLKIKPTHSKLILNADLNLMNQFNQLVLKQNTNNLPIIGLHISARKVDQRWPASYFIELVEKLSFQDSYQFILLWSPGDEHNKQHPGDNQKAQTILEALNNFPILPCPTEKLEELIAALAICDLVVCSDGGAMHVAAGLGKPIVCFFGSSDAKQWHPWQVPHVVLQHESNKVIDIDPTQVIEKIHYMIELSL